jgi:hypothetical protein
LRRLRDFETYVNDAVALTFAAIVFGVFEKKHSETSDNENPQFRQRTFAEPNEHEASDQNNRTNDCGFEVSE